MLDVNDLLAPLTADEFLAETWEREPRLLRSPGRSFHSILAPGDLDALLAYGAPLVRVVRDGESPVAVSPATVEGGHFVDALHLGYLGGATLAMQALHQKWAPIGRFCASLSRWFSAPVGANLYLTPPAAQGFPPHHDSHDVFILQILGRKRWRLYGSRVELPLHDQNGPTPADACGPVLDEPILEEGDVLYLPRGVIHEAASLDRPSAHLTVGVYPYRVVDLLHAALKTLAEEDVELRRALPVGLLRGRGEEAAGEALDRFRDLLWRARPEAARDDLALRLAREGPPSQAVRFGALLDPPAVDLDTQLVRIHGVACTVTCNGDHAAIEFLSKAVRGPAFLEPALRLVARKTTLTPRDLPDDLDDAAKLVLARRLIREGLLSPG
jgi:ribosomal protein L16 Arg81 hydroxylase